jgi:hypothetical protein
MQIEHNDASPILTGEIVAAAAPLALAELA